MSDSCKLLAGPAAAAAQLLLAVAAVGALVLKRRKEKPQRPIRVWGFDVAKQVVSSGAAHVCGILIAIIVAETGGERRVSQCAWYFVAYSFDTTVGVATAIGLHTLVVKLTQRQPPAGRWGRLCAVIADCGNYGSPPQLDRFALQLLEWTICVVLARVICGSLVVASKHVLVRVAGVLDIAFRGHPVALLFFVMIMCPLFMNLLQALVQDAVLKMRGGGKGGSNPVGAGKPSDPALDHIVLLETVERG